MYLALADVIMTENNQENLTRYQNVSVGFDEKIIITKVFLAELLKNDIAVWDFSTFMDEVLIAPGTSNELIPYVDVQKFAKENKLALLAVDGADHHFTEPRILEETLDEIIDLLVCEEFCDAMYRMVIGGIGFE